jgi:hypothetical protein
MEGRTFIERSNLLTFMEMVPHFSPSGGRKPITELQPRVPKAAADLDRSDCGRLVMMYIFARSFKLA